MHAIAEAADVHAGPEPDVFERAEGLDAGFSIVGGHGCVREKEATGRADKRNPRSRSESNEAR